MSNPPWMQTFRGNHINLEEFTPENVDILDIAKSLDLVNRYNGHTRVAMPVALHAVTVARYIELEHNDFDLALIGLHHDDAEAYVGDMNKWLKRMPQMEYYRMIEQRVHNAIMDYFSLPRELPDAIHEADRMMLRFEVTWLYGKWEAPAGYDKLSDQEWSRIADRLKFNEIVDIDAGQVYLAEHERLQRKEHFYAE